jgi:hypothetical protein
MAQHPDVEVYHGKKRPAESDLDGEQPLAKKFNRLHIGMLDIHHNFIFFSFISLF